MNNPCIFMWGLFLFDNKVLLCYTEFVVFKISDPKGEILCFKINIKLYF